MSNTWPLNAAKSKLSKLIGQAQSDGPQIITRYGKKVAVVLSYEEYMEQQMLGYFRSAPRVGVDLNLERDSSQPSTSE